MDGDLVNLTHTINLDITIDGDAWLNLENPDMTMEQALEEVKAMGNTVYAIDYEKRRFKVADVPPTPATIDVWFCDYCPTYSKYREKVEDHEKVCNNKPR